ncbi:MAG: M20/M25/M40 family metallo-hydrolase [Rhodothermales bacterium]
MLLSVLPGSAVKAQPSSESLQSITTTDLKRHLSFLASDELGGRYSFAPSGPITARYLATQLASYGYRGAGPDSSFFQNVPLSHGTVDPSQSRLVLTVRGVAQPFTYESDYMLETPGEIPAYVQSELVFAGYGISSPRHHYDDYTGLDVKGKFVITVKGTPESLNEVVLAWDERGNAAAAAHGARGHIVISQGLLSNYAVYSASYAERAFYGFSRPATTEALQVVQAGPALVKAIADALGLEEDFLVAPEGKPLAPRAIPATVEITTRFEAEAMPPTYNVLGILEGADPSLKDEYVAFGAHYDHLPASTNGPVFNGADDNASGTAAILEVAQALAAGPRPGRSTLIVFFTAEEIGLYGSKYFIDYEPVVPLGNLVAFLDADMVGRSREEGGSGSLNTDLTDQNTVYLLGADRRSRELYHLSEQANAETVQLQLDYTYQGPRGLMFLRSDHYNFDRHGIPVIWYHTGGPPEYHKPTDDVEKIDFEKLARISQLIVATGWRVLNLDHRLVVDNP